MTNINSKADLIKVVASAHGLTQSQAADVVDTMLTGIQETLKAGGKVSLHGFGTFYTKERAARMGRNPATGASIQIEATTNVKFKPTSGFLS